MTHEELIKEALRMWQYVPFRRCWIAEKEGEQGIFILKADARMANKYAQAGWSVSELKRS
jgi:hypothetical protein